MFWQALSRGVRLRCPRCGEGHVFSRLLTYAVRHECESCGLVYDPHGESVAFMYLSTAFITGLFFIVLITVPPENLALYRVLLVIGALAVYGISMPLRKGIAIALTWLQRRS